MGMLDEVGSYLEATLSFTSGTDLFYGQYPDSPDDLVALFQLPMGEPDFTLGAAAGQPHKPNWENLRLQVLVRRSGPTAYPDAETVAYQLWRALSLVDTLVSGVRYLSISPVDSPAPLEEDPDRRISFVVNFTVKRTIT